MSDPFAGIPDGYNRASQTQYRPIETGDETSTLKPGERKLQILQTLAEMLETRRAKRSPPLPSPPSWIVPRPPYRHFASKAQMFEGLIEFIESSPFRHQPGAGRGTDGRCRPNTSSRCCCVSREEPRHDPRADRRSAGERKRTPAGLHQRPARQASKPPSKSLRVAVVTQAASTSALISAPWPTSSSATPSAAGRARQIRAFGEPLAQWAQQWPMLAVAIWRRSKRLDRRAGFKDKSCHVGRPFFYSGSCSVASNNFLTELTPTTPSHNGHPRIAAPIDARKNTNYHQSGIFLALDLSHR